MQQDPLLATKLHIPPMRSEVIPRPRLLERLDSGRNCRFTLVSAPAGFGKTTLLSEWIAGSGQTVAWLSLEGADSDLNRFLAYLVAALQTVATGIGHGVLAALQSPGGPAEVNVEAALTGLINEIAGDANGLVLVLDDYHVIESQAVDKALAFLLAHLPPPPRGMRLVVASRADPSLPLSRLRAGGQMHEIREHDLRFRRNEVAAFLDRAMGLDLSQENVAALEARTEGWIAGLQLAGLSMQGLERSVEITRFVDGFAGSDRYIHDYLTDEVLRRRPEGTKEFLLQTSILERLSGPLCDAVTGRGNSQAMLEVLEAANLFIVPLDSERRWYRYHHLFGELLRQRLIKSPPDCGEEQGVAALHLRASAWYEEAGYIDDAFRHAQVAGDCERAAAILEEHWQVAVHGGELTKLRLQLDALGPDCTAKSAPLSMAYCWIHALTGAVDSVPDHLGDVREALLGRSGEQAVLRYAVIPSLIETMEAIIALDRSQPGEAKEHAQKAISLIPNDAAPDARGLLQGAADYRLAQAHRRLGEYDEACAVLLEVLEVLKASGNFYGVAGTVLQTATMYQAMGRTQASIALCQETVGYMEENHLESLPPSGMVYVALAGAHLEAGRLEEATRNLGIGQRLAEQLGSPEIQKLAETIDQKLANAAMPHQPLIEPLSPRELQVLKMIADGFSNRDIGRELYLALSTVKGHNRRIYGKLQVQRRTEAVARARELDLL